MPARLRFGFGATRRRRVPLLLLLLWLGATLVSVRGFEGDNEEEGVKYLYLDKDDVHPVMEFIKADGSERVKHEGDFRTTVNPKVVEFYNPYCGACQTYKPKYIALAREVQKQNPKIDFYAVSCSVHNEICDEYATNGVPSLLVFDDGVSVMPKNMRILKQREKSAEFILELFSNGNLRNLTDNDNQDKSHRGRGRRGQPSRLRGPPPDNTVGSLMIRGKRRHMEESTEEVDGVEGVDARGGDGGDEGALVAEGDNAGLVVGGGEEDEEGDNVGLGGGGGGDSPDGTDEGATEAGLNEMDAQEGEPVNNGIQISGQNIEQNWSDQNLEEDSGENMPAANRRGSDAAAATADEEEEVSQEEGGEGQGATSMIEAAGKGLMNMVVEDNADGAEDEDNTKDISTLDPPELGTEVNVPKRVRAGAGALMGGELPRDMDRFKAAIAKGRTPPKRAFFRRKKKEQIAPEDMDRNAGRTTTMKAHTPGTREYHERLRLVRDNLDTIMGRQGVRPKESGKKTLPAGGRTAGAGWAHVGFKKEIRKPNVIKRVAENMPLTRSFVTMSHEESLILDASLSFLVGLKHGVSFSQGPLPYEKKEVLRSWLELLRVSLPPEWALHETILALEGGIDQITKDNDSLHKFLVDHRLPRKQWSRDCRRKGDQAGFTCGFWKLLHVATVGVAEHRGGINLIDADVVSSDARTFSPAEAAEVIKDYIDNFFPCRPCKEHFVQQYEVCSNRRCDRLTDSKATATHADWLELSMWLWEVHNDVSVRILHENEDRASVTQQDEIKVLFPNLEDCLLCFKDDGSWDEHNVFLFLEKNYWPGSDLDPRAARLINFYDTEPAGFTLLWIVVILCFGAIYSCRPQIGVAFPAAVVRATGGPIRPKKRSE